MMIIVMVMMMAMIMVLMIFECLAALNFITGISEIEQNNTVCFLMKF